MSALQNEDPNPTYHGYHGRSYQCLSQRFQHVTSPSDHSNSPVSHGSHRSAAEKPDGSCRSQADWELAFRNIQKLPGGPFDQARLFATSDCNTLARAVPAALAANTRILVGVWTEDEAHFGREKAALLDAIQKYGGGWITAISVGSETLYRKEADPNRLAQQIYDVRGMVRSVGVGQAVGHVDTWTAW